MAIRFFYLSNFLAGFFMHRTALESLGFIRFLARSVALLIVTSAPIAHAADGWQTTGNLQASRVNDNPGVTNAVRLANGKIFVAGGRNIVANGTIVRNTGEIFDPTTGAWTIAGTMTVPRFDGSTTVLPDGKVLIAGGNTMIGSAEGHTATAELYDPATGTFTATGSMNVPRMDHTATLLPNGKVLIAGGRRSNFIFNPESELYDPTTGTF
jgi:hypothetical protein